MLTLYFVLYLLAAICFVLSAFGVSVQKVNVLALGLFFWVLVPLLMTFQALD